jgi:hypothetical protein
MTESATLHETAGVAAGLSGVGAIGQAGTVHFQVGTGHFGLAGEAVARRTVIARTVCANRASVQLAALSLIAGLDARIQQIKEGRSNSGVVDDLDELENLRKLVAQFLNALSHSTADEELAEATLSVKEGFRRWWTKDHAAICGKAYNLSLFAGGLAVCALSGAVPDKYTIMTVGALVGGPAVAEAIKSCAAAFEKDSS